MISADDLILLASHISEERINTLANHVENKDPTSITWLDLEQLGFMSSESHKITNVMRGTKDGGLLASSLRLALKIVAFEKKNEIQLVISGNFQDANAEYTHETVYKMINRAKHSITIVGYWMYDIDDLIKKISDLQEVRNLKVRFILDSAQKWKRQILHVWNKKYRPEILEVNTDHVKTLHAKLIIIDNSEILITSANLTMNAMEKNIEAGIWTSNTDIIKSCYDVLEEFKNKNIIFNSKKGI